MGIGPGLVIRGALIAALFTVILTSAITAGAEAPSPQINSTAGDSQQTNKTIESNLEETLNNSISCEVSPNFPEHVTKWCELITGYALENDLSPDLIAALIWQESGGKPQAYSKSGAVGLMQIMPRDGIAASFKCVNGPCFSNRPTIKELEDPEFNVKYGTSMLARLIKKNGNLRDALKAYGPMDIGYYYADKVLSLYNQYGN